MFDKKPAKPSIFITLLLGSFLSGGYLHAQGSNLGHWLDIGFEHRVRYETLTNRFRLGERGGDQQLPLRTRLSFGLKIKPIHFMFELQDSRIYLDDAESTVSNSMVNQLDIQQLHVELALNEITGSRYSHKFVFGRQSFDLGSRRLFARNRFRNTTNAFNGLLWSCGIENRWAIDAFVFQPVGRKLEDWDRGQRGTYLWGAFFKDRLQTRIGMELYYFGFKKSYSTTDPTRRRYDTMGGRFFNWDGSGGLEYELETMWQFGTVDSLDHFAHSHHVSVGYTFDAAWKPTLKGQYDYAGGDKNPDDQRSGTFDRLYGARRFDFGPTGIYGWISRSNISAPEIRLILKPSSRLELVSANRWSWLAQRRDSWTGTGLRDKTGRSGSYIGSQAEIRLRCDFEGYLRAELGYARFFKGSFPERVPESPGTGDSNYLYLQLIFRIEDLLQ